MQTRQPFDALRETYERVAREEAKTYASAAHEAQDQSFVAQRFVEGESIARLLAERLGDGHPLRVLDIGTGNAGVAIAVANVVTNEVTGLDHALNMEVVHLLDATRIPVRYVAGTGVRLPLRDESFDVVLCLETIEHVARPELLGGEIMRVLRRGGLCVLTTPARLKFLFRRDPHFGIPGLLLLPDGLQRWVATKLTRTVKEADYDVAHIYWYTGSLARMFPSRDMFQAVGAPPANPLARKFWSLMQRFTWERCIIRKA